MPYTRKKRNYARRNRRPRIYGTKAKFIPRGLAHKRYGNVSTKTFYFKASGSINGDNSGNTNFAFRTQQIPANPGDPLRMPDVADAYTIAECYTEYKVLAVKVRLFAANIGVEVGQIGTLGLPQAAGFNRGNCVTFIDQEIRENEPVQTNILNVMNLGSCRMMPARISQYTRTMFRKKGVPGWGCCDRNVPVANREPDPWAGGIFLLGNNARASPTVNPLWFYTVTYKIIFRGRSFTP